MFLRAIFFVLSIFVFGCQMCSKPMQDSRLYNIEYGFDDIKSELWVKVKMAKNIHAYAEGEKIGRPVALRVMEENGWQKTAEAEIPKGKVKNNSVLIEKDFTVKQHLKKGDGVLKAFFDIQVCGNSNCYAPQTHEIIIK